MADGNVTISPGDAPANSGSSEATLTQRINGLDAQLADTQKEIAELKKSDRSWFKRAGIIIGVLAGIIAIPKAAKDALNVFVPPRPNTTVQWGKPLDVQYDVHNRILRLEFPVLADNEGVANDSIDELSATLHSDGNNSVRVLVGNSDIEVSDQGKSVLQPIPVQSRQARSLVIGLSLSSPFSEQVLALEGRRKVDVVLKTQGNRTISESYCFDFDKTQGEEVLAAREMRVWTPSCD